MRTEPNEFGHGSTVSCEAEDDLAAVPNTHRFLLTPEIRRVFLDPRKHFREVADRCHFPKMAQWLRTMTEKGRWELVLYHFDFDPQFSQSGYLWRAEGIRGAVVGPSRNQRMRKHPEEVQHYYSLVDFVNLNGFGAAGCLYGGGEFTPLAAFYCDRNRTPDDLLSTYVWGDSPCGDKLFFTADGRAGWYKMGSRELSFRGTFAETVNLIFSALLANKTPDEEYTGRPQFAGGNWGFIDRNGVEVLPYQFEHASSFQNGLANVRVAGLEGHIDRTGHYVIAPTWEGLGDFQDGLACAKREGKWGFIDLSGQFVIPPRYDTYVSFSEGLGEFEVAELHGYIDRSGKVIIPAMYSEAGEFSEGLASVREAEDKSSCWFIDSTGRRVLGPFVEAEKFAEGLARVLDSSGTVRFIDTKGNTCVTLPPQMEARSYSNGLVRVKCKLAMERDSRTKSGWALLRRLSSSLGKVLRGQGSGNAAEDKTPLWGYLDRNGNWAIKPQFDYADCFRNGYAVVAVNGRKGLIDPKGNFLVPPEFRKLEDLHDRRIAFGRDDLTGFLDERGRVVIEPAYYTAQHFSEGLTAVCQAVEK